MKNSLKDINKPREVQTADGIPSRAPSKCTLKRDTAARLSERPERRTPTTPTAGENVEQREHSSRRVGRRAGSTAEAGSVVLVELDILLQYHPGIVLSWYLHNGAGIAYPHKSLHTVVDSGLIRN